MTDQHAVILRTDPAIVGYAEARGGPGNPRMIDHVALPEELGSLGQAYWARALAHELLHCVNVYHHGKDDTLVEWSLNTDGELMEVVVQQDKARKASLIRVLREDGVEQTGTLKARLSGRPGRSFRLLRGEPQGLHSGFEDCLMRYDIAETYASQKDSSIRYFVRENVPRSICNTKDGTGVNAPGRLPQSRYGPAAAGRGDCVHQILVNDGVDAPSRSLKK